MKRDRWAIAAQRIVDSKAAVYRDGIALTALIARALRREYRRGVKIADEREYSSR
jgi:hypothetical protein